MIIMWRDTKIPQMAQLLWHWENNYWLWLWCIKQLCDCNSRPLVISNYYNLYMDFEIINWCKPWKWKINFQIFELIYSLEKLSVSKKIPLSHCGWWCINIKLKIGQWAIPQMLSHIFPIHVGVLPGLIINTGPCTLRICSYYTQMSRYHQPRTSTHTLIT